MNAYQADFLLSRLLYRDGLMLVVDKPAGLPVHAGPGGGDNLEKYFDALKFGLPRPPALAHRLDRDTSGCLVLGRHRKALAKLGKLFQQNRVEKTYWAICAGAPEKPSGTIGLPLKKEMSRTGWRMITAPDGQEAATTYRTLSSANGLYFIEAKPKTGRTHQIRVHLAAIGAPIVGDGVYGADTEENRRTPMMLHARRIIVPLSANKEAVKVEAPPPSPMASALAAIGMGDYSAS